MCRHRRVELLLLPLTVCLIPFWALAAGSEHGTYQVLTEQIAEERLALSCAFRSSSRGTRTAFLQELEQTLLGRIDQLTRRWLGTRWGLGLPQTTRPGRGKVNCGAFVALVLRHAGFNLPVWKLQRQTARMAIRSLSPRRAIRYFKDAPMDRFVRTVRAMGPGLFIIGLDFHIGFLRLDETRGLRFVHASYLTHTVVDEPADRAGPIVTSRWRVVGKILQPDMLRAWLSGQRLRVLGRR